MTPLVLVHGFLGGAAQWQLQVGELGAGRSLIPVGLPGFGDRCSDPAIDTIEGFARSVIADLDAKGVKQFDLLGHSMGGMVVQEVLRLVPGRVQKLVLYGTGASGLLPGRFETIDESKRRAREEGLEKTARRISATWFLSREDAAPYPACAAIAALTAQAAFDAGLDAMQHWSGEAHLFAIASKTLVLWGDGDRTYPWAQTEKLWQSIEGARLAVIPGCAHAVHLEKPALFNAVLRDFLEG